MQNKGRVFIWSLFDFANSTYAVIIAAFVFVVYFKEVIFSNEPAGDFYWSLAINVSMIASAVLNPVCGAIADLSGMKKKFLFFFTMLCVICTGLLYFTGEGTILLAFTLFALSNVGFQTGLTFYDAFIPELGPEKDYNRISGIGYAVGYIGSICALALVFPFMDDPPLLFLLTGIVFFLFSLPLFLFLKEEKKEAEHTIGYYAKYGFSKVFRTLKSLKDKKDIRNYLIAFFFYIDAVNTIIFFSALFARETLNFSLTELAVFFLLVQITAMGGSLLFAYIGDKIGLKRSLVLNLIFWLILILIIFFFVNAESYVNIAGNQIHLYFIIGALAGTFLGSTQSLSRAIMAKLVPLESKTELFGFYALMDKTSTLLGPLTFGLISWLSGNQKLAVLALGIFFIIGLLLLKNIKINNIEKQLT